MIVLFSCYSHRKFLSYEIQAICIQKVRHRVEEGVDPNWQIFIFSQLIFLNWVKFSIPEKNEIPRGTFFPWIPIESYTTCDIPGKSRLPTPPPHHHPSPI